MDDDGSLVRQSFSRICYADQSLREPPHPPTRTLLWVSWQGRTWTVSCILQFMPFQMSGSDLSTLVPSCAKQGGLPVIWSECLWDAFSFQCEADLAKHCAYVVFHDLGTNVEHVKIMILFSWGNAIAFILYFRQRQSLEVNLESVRYALLTGAVFAAVALLTGRIVFGVDIARIQLWLTRCPRSV